MSNELTITSIYNDIGNTYDSMLNSLTNATLLHNQALMLQCLICYKLQVWLDANTKEESTERKEALEMILSILAKTSSIDDISDEDV